MLSLDEPELNLHPAWSNVISNWMLKTDSAGQLFVSTSPDLLNGFTEGFRQGEVNLYSFSLNEEESMKRVTSDQVDRLFAEG